MLFDEKIGGTIHIAVGHGFPEIGGTNVSAIHWDMLCDMSDGEIVVTLEPGTIVALLKSKKQEDGIIWRQIRVDDDKNGWVLDSFLEKCS